jgi:fatty acid desaturase
MYPAVPFYNLGKLRDLIKDDLPAAPHGLIATWREMLTLRQQFLADPNFKYIPQLPTKR